ncbi:PROBABLE CONSERVED TRANSMEMBRANE PROTEIN [Leucobacter sp. 7(1)]|uniref:DUF3054 domain-containing protein n=1 Tax=Leucobacter sp. 7(1) TaxID=1255613 RepID=UPI00097F1938|nr:DUF3054 domain-containing protein [Leucobacter sp. 7(1)]SJN12789.1 PROBABLE CONSERVED TRANSMEMBRANE PROTEIN [Leucobacter sp. 7(1)]
MSGETRSRSATLTPALALLCDAALVVLFAALGRGSHAREATLLGLVDTAWPFLAALLVSWVAARAWRRPAALIRTGLPVWLGTVVLGLGLRWMTGGGMAPAFIVVTLLTLGLFLLGWRGIAALVGRLRRPRAA